MKLTKRRLIFTATVLIADLFFFCLIDPGKVASPLLFLAFALLALNLFVVWYLLFFAARALTTYPRGRLKRPVYLATAASLLLLALQSIGQLTPRDVIALIVLSIIFWAYSSYYSPRRARQP